MGLKEFMERKTQNILTIHMSLIWKMLKKLYNYTLSTVDDSIQDLIFMTMSRYREVILLYM